MLSKSQMHDVMKKLVKSQYLVIIIAGEALTIRHSEGFNKLEMSIPVFSGGNYIPKSVRGGILKAKSAFPYSSISTYFTLDEERFQVVLNFTMSLERGFDGFENFLREFLWQAEEWREIMNRYGEEDLVFVHVNK